MSNYFKLQNRFILVDVEGVLLTNPNDELEIREPANIRDTQITLERNAETHGVDFEFSEADTPFGFDRNKKEGHTYSSHELIKAIATENGPDGKCIFRAESRRPAFFQEITRLGSDPNNIESVSNFIRLFGDYNINPGDQLTITTATASIYNGQTYTVLTVLPPSDIFAGYTVFSVASVADSAYSGDWNLDLTPAFQIDYQGDLDFNTFDEGETQIDINSRRINIDDLFRTRRDFVVNMNDTTSIGGVALAPPTAETLFLHSKALESSQKAGSRGEAEGPSTVEFTSGATDYLLQLDFQNRTSSTTTISDFSISLETEYGTGLFTQLTEQTIEEIQEHFFFQNIGGQLEIDYTADYALFLSNFNTQTVEYLGTFIRINETETSISSAVTFNVNSASFLCEIDFTYTGTLSVPRNARVSIYDKWEIPVNTGITQSHDIIVNANHVMEMTFTGTTDNSTASVYHPFDVVDHVLGVINDRANILISNFLKNAGNLSFLTNGYLIRGFTPTERPLLGSFTDFFDNWLQPTFGLGFGVVNDSGVNRLVMERYEHFYQDKEIVFISTVDDETIDITFDNDYTFNQLRIGYEDFPESTDENKQNNIDEFNTVHDLLTPLERIRRVGEFVSGVIGSGYKIENQRREQFSDVPQDTVSDDDKLFVIQGVQGDDYEIQPFPDQSVQIVIIETNSVSLYGTYYDIQVNDTVTIVREDAFVLLNNETVTSVSIDGFYTVLGVGATLSPGGSTANSWTVTVSGNRARAARNEEFETLDNVIDANTVYNAGLNPKYMLFNHARLINSGLNFKNSTDSIITNNVQLNGQMISQFKGTRGTYTLAEPSQSIQMNASVQLQDMDSFNRLFTGRIIKFECDLDYDTIVSIREAYLDMADPNHYGFITVDNIIGTQISGYLMSMTYSLFSDRVTMTLREKGPSFALVEFTHQLVSGFASSTLACDTTTSASTFYSDTSPIVVGSTIYTTEGNPGSTVSDGWLYEPSQDRSIRTVSGVVQEIVVCPADPPIEPDKFADYEYNELILFTKSNTVSTEIESVDYGEVDQVNINLGTDGTLVRATYVATASDITNVTGGELMLLVEVFNGPSGTDPLIQSLSDTASSARQLSVTITVDDADITTTAFVRVTLAPFGI